MKKKVYIIAEVGPNHQGSVKSAVRYIKVLSKIGVDAVKFQKRNPEISTPLKKQNDIRNTPWGNISYLQYKKKIT